MQKFESSTRQRNSGKVAALNMVIIRIVDSFIHSYWKGHVVRKIMLRNATSGLVLLIIFGKNFKFGIFQLFLNF